MSVVPAQLHTFIVSGCLPDDLDTCCTHDSMNRIVSYLEARCNFLSKGGCLVPNVAYLLSVLIGDVQNSKLLPLLCVIVIVV